MFSFLGRRKLSACVGIASFSTLRYTAPLLAEAQTTRQSRAPKTAPAASTRTLQQSEDVEGGGVSFDGPSSTLESLLRSNREKETDMTGTLAADDRPSLTAEWEEGEEEEEEGASDTTTSKRKKSQKKKSARKDPRVLDEAERPVNLSGSHYEGELEEALKAAACKNSFTHSIWSTRTGYKLYGVSVVVPEERGLSVVINNQPVLLYNIIQTSSAEMTAGKTVPQILRYLKESEQKKKKEGYLKRVPRTISGKPLYDTFHDLVVQSAIYPQFKEKCNIWVTLEEIVSLFADVKKEEIPNAILGPLRSAPNPSLDEEMLEKMKKYSDALGVNAPCTTIFYNLMQLSDKWRFEPYYGGVGHICVNVNGRVYGNVMSFLMCEYCTKYKFSKKYALFVTNDCVKKYEGHVLPEVNGEKPPPFTTVVRGDVVSLFHAEQTTISTFLYERMFSARQNEREYLRAKYEKATEFEEEPAESSEESS